MVADRDVASSKRIRNRYLATTCVVAVAVLALGWPMGTKMGLAMGIAASLIVAAGLWLAISRAYGSISGAPRRDRVAFWILVPISVVGAAFAAGMLAMYAGLEYELGKQRSAGAPSTSQVYQPTAPHTP